MMNILFAISPPYIQTHNISLCLLKIVFYMCMVQNQFLLLGACQKSLEDITDEGGGE